MGENGAMRATAIVAAGGACGALARWAVAEAMPVEAGAFPWATFVVNVVGCLAIGLAARSIVRGTELWYGLVTGVLGGLTTFSAFALEARDLVADDRTVIAVAYVGATLAAGSIAVELGRTRGRRAR